MLDGTYRGSNGTVLEVREPDYSYNPGIPGYFPLIAYVVKLDVVDRPQVFTEQYLELLEPRG